MGVSTVNITRGSAWSRNKSIKGFPTYICAVNVETVVLEQRDACFHIIQSRYLLILPDGMPLIWYARIMGEKSVERVTGYDLMAEIFKMSSECGFSHYFYGDTEETLSGIERKMHELYPGAEIRGMCSPPFRLLRDDEIDGTVAEINRLKPTFVWVALGVPKQERWMVRVLPHIDSSILIGVGAAFRLLTGKYKSPPRFVQISGLAGLLWRPLWGIAWFYPYHALAFSTLMLKELARRVFQS